MKPISREHPEADTKEGSFFVNPSYTKKSNKVDVEDGGESIAESALPRLIERIFERMSIGRAKPSATPGPELVQSLHRRPTQPNQNPQHSRQKSININDLFRAVLWGRARNPQKTGLIMGEADARLCHEG